MKIAAVALAACVALASAVEYPLCDIGKLTKVNSGANYAACVKKLDVLRNPNATAPPTALASAIARARSTITIPEFPDAELDIICLYGACIGYFDDIKAAEPKECEVKDGDADYLLYTDYVNPILRQCKDKGKTPAPNPGQNPSQKPTSKPPKPSC